MPIFISYSQKDRGFVETLARNLVAAKHHIWIDQWELSVGDSLTKKIEGALSSADAILVILSKNSVESEWCKLELSSGLIRELEEKKVLLMPCVIDDCKVPLLLRDKLRADFRKDADEAFSLLDRSLSKISNPHQGRVEAPQFHTDWAVDWRKQDDGTWLLRWTFVDHGHEWPYVILTVCNIFCDKEASAAFQNSLRRNEMDEFMIELLGNVVSTFKHNPLEVPIEDQFEKFVGWRVKDGIRSYTVHITYRRLGEDNGMDTVVHIDSNLRNVRQQMIGVLRKSAG
jgi:hypothetical protein